MKTLFGKFYYVFIVFAICAIGFAFMPEESEGSYTFYQYPAGTTYVSDTIVNAANDTITPPTGDLLKGLWLNPTLEFITTQLSGSGSIIVIVQESAYSGSVANVPQWFEVARDTFTSSADGRIEWDAVRGFKVRFILDGTGTQSTVYKTHFITKRNAS